MREFNTSGPCHPAQHYTVLREALIAKGFDKVRKGQYFTPCLHPDKGQKQPYFQLPPGAR
ncbi:hypothetical protein BGS_1338 [Beggiatoa sp. SS]|nr:hypothetical protein BGS_1338 [Beggiatoa sp. SS]